MKRMRRRNSHIVGIVLVRRAARGMTAGRLARIFLRACRPGDEDDVTNTAPLDVRQLVDRLVAFDTTSRNSNLALIDFVRDYLDRFGIASDLVFDATGEKANLFATLGPAAEPGVVLSGHTDVVPVDGQDWSSEPFTCVLRDDRLYGRGTTDMKGFIACALALIPEFRAMRLAAPIHLALSYDEEVGCKGVPGLLDHIAHRLPARPRGCVVGEPTGMRVANGHKGKAGYVCTVTGLASHSALNHLGVNAIEVAAAIIAKLRRLNDEFKAAGPFAPGFEPPHSTVSTGVIEGGSALNIVPDRCRFEFEFRPLPGQDPGALFARVREWAERNLLPAMRAVSPATGIEWRELMSYPGLGGTNGAAIEEVCCRVSATAQPLKLAFGTEAGHFAVRGIPAVVCGPGDIRVAHKADEYVELAQLDQCTRFLRDLVRATVAA
jgi:acetylornithine deacetylase